MKQFVIVAAVVAIAWFLFFKTPSSRSIAQATRIHVDEGTIEYGNAIYDVVWREPATFSGDIRYVGRAYTRYAPFITHDAVITTGEFSDPQIVEIAPIKNGTTYWRAGKQPDGTLVVLHFVPASVEIHDLLAGLETGETVTIAGKLEDDGTITGPHGGYLKLMHDNHKIILVTGVE